MAYLDNHNADPKNLPLIWTKTAYCRGRGKAHVPTESDERPCRQVPECSGSQRPMKLLTSGGE
jgi:hypothetical protein